MKNKILTWSPPHIEDVNSIMTGDMPGDKVCIDKEHIKKANVLFPLLVERILAFKEGTHNDKIIVAVHGGSGVGKSEIGSLLAHYLKVFGMETYVLSGDNYPHRIPKDNDAHREKIFKEGGREALNAYLGSSQEIDFEGLNKILRQFKEGQAEISLKRMGRTQDALWYDTVDFSNVHVMVVEWTHGHNENLIGVDIPILLNSTPEETLAHRKSRNRDGQTDSPFTTMVLELEQEKLKRQADEQTIILSKSGRLIRYKTFKNIMDKPVAKIGPMLNVYPDSIGGTLKGVLELLNIPLAKDCFESCYILPSIFDTDLDRGFSVIDYKLNTLYGQQEDLERFKAMGIDLKLDFILNHASVLSKEFQDLVKNGRESKYADFFIQWNKFWEGYGQMTSEGYILPDEAYLNQMFFRKPGLPILMVRMPDGEEVPYWNTFYQEVRYDPVDAVDLVQACGIQYATAQLISQRVNQVLKDGQRPMEIDFSGFEIYKKQVLDLIESKRKYLGQMDLNIQSPLVWEFYEKTLKSLKSYGASIVRLDAFAYAPKKPGEKNFLNEPDTWTLLEKVKKLANKYEVKLLPEIHASYVQGTYKKIARQGYMTYDFFLPGLLIDALERQDARVLKTWMDEVIEEDIQTVNMLGCHDGIPLLDLKGLLSQEQIQNIIDIVVERGGYVKDLHGAKNMYYQVNATYYSALGEDDRKMLLARAVQMFAPGKPQVWYLDVLAGVNDYETIKKAGPGGHKEINRTNLSMDEVKAKVKLPIVSRQFELIRLRNTHQAFHRDAKIVVETPTKSTLVIIWTYKEHKAKLVADFSEYSFEVIV